MQLSSSFQPLRMVRARAINKANQICESVDGEDHCVQCTVQDHSNEGRHGDNLMTRKDNFIDVNVEKEYKCQAS